MKIQLTQKQAFQAMVLFLQKYYTETKSDDVASLLGDLRFMSDGETCDPASWSDWIEIVEKVRHHSKEVDKVTKFKLKK